MVVFIRLEIWGTLSMFYKKRFIRNTSLIPEKIKKRGLVLSEILRNDIFVLFNGDFSSS